MLVTAYLNFSGECEQALAYYEKHLGGRIEMLLRFEGTPAAGHVPADWARRVMHARMRVGDTLIMASDAPPDRYDAPKGMSLSLGTDTQADAERIFAALADNGTVRMPLQENFFASRYGMVTDRFGIPWMVVCQHTEREVTITRVIDAPRELLFAMWTEPKHLVQWWGPQGFTNPVCEVDARPGGVLKIVMRAPNGAEHPMKGVFREVVKPERLVFTNIPLDDKGQDLMDGLTTVTFENAGSGKTKMTMHTRARALAPIAARMLEGMHAGWTQTIDRLEALVGKRYR